ncbi:hypothetical protein FHS43_004242 [Streptosporangium becharense]|uniref:DUF397 domain-containing protein n=1 Tax=Streptosporangium becharense TaxID=1816182 RepID=A0A7W9IDN5_9ACTN|nr:DUF397 domain-containing protein [Streptosporangium becharense]MBB2912947.1 hypothetical protein [Streptosporangium becharense]MBB5818228.1 hypothetical protein [Streptosporangium becharense]
MEAADLIGLDLSGAAWKKSSLSGDSGGNCVEVAGNLPGVVAVRDSKNPTGPALTFTSGDWQTFLNAVKSGRFD